MDWVHAFHSIQGQRPLLTQNEVGTRVGRLRQGPHRRYLQSLLLCPFNSGFCPPLSNHRCPGPFISSTCSCSEFSLLLSLLLLRKGCFRTLTRWGGREPSGVWARKWTVSLQMMECRIWGTRSPAQPPPLVLIGRTEGKHPKWKRAGIPSHQERLPTASPSARPLLP